MAETLKLAVQKSGRLSDRSLAFIESCGISFSRNKTKLKASSHNFPLELLFLRDDDIPKYVADGVADIGFVGQNVVAEKGQTVDTLEYMGFSKCRLSLAVRQSEAYAGVADLAGKRIATSYPVLLQQYLTEKEVSAEIHEISGSVEIAPSIGLADAVCDIVSTGSTLLSNGLREVEVIFKSQAVMIGTPNMVPAKQLILEQLRFRIQATLRAKAYKYVVMNVPTEAVQEIARVIPGMKSPTVTPLSTPGWSSMHSVIEEADFWDKIDQMRQLGAEGILVLPIEKMIQ